MDEKPPIRRLVLKARDVEPVDKASRPGDGTAISVKLIHLENKQAAERPARAPAQNVRPEEIPSVFKLKDIMPIDPPSREGDESAISVSGILRENRVAAFEAESELIAMPARRRSRRNRDFALLVSCAVLAVGTLAAVFRHDLQLVGLGLFVIVFVTVILGWIMYGVMDRY